MAKGLDPHIRHERQTIKPTVTQTEEKTPTCKPKVGLRRKLKMVMSPQPKQVIVPTAEKPKPEIMTEPQVISKTEHVPSVQTVHKHPLSPKVVTRQVPSY